MTIAVHIQQSGSSSFLLSYISALATQQHKHRFILFTEDKKSITGLPQNCQNVFIKPKPSNSVLLHFWYNYRLPALLKKHHTSLFISENNMLSLRSAVPQIMLLKDSAVLQPTRLKFTNKGYLKAYFPRFVKRAHGLLASSPAMAHLFAKQYPAEHQNLKNVFYGLAPEYKQTQDEMVESIRAKHTRGHAYFVAECNRFNQPQMIVLLKAFSIFKKRLKSGMQLLLINKAGENPVADFRLYKYREEVQMITPQSLAEEALFIGAAYGGIEICSPAAYQNWGLGCMQCGVPLITTENDVAIAQYGDAALYTEIKEQDIANQMMMLYKDEALHHKLAVQGVELTGNYTWEHSSQLLWQSILQCSKD